MEDFCHSLCIGLVQDEFFIRFLEPEYVLLRLLTGRHLHHVANHL